MRLELTHGSGAKTFVNSHGQLIHISLDGQYHLLGEEMTLTHKQLEEVMGVINRQGGRWDHPAVMAKVQDLRHSADPTPGSSTPEPASPPVSDPPIPAATEAEASPQTTSGETEAATGLAS